MSVNFMEGFKGLLLLLFFMVTEDNKMYMYMCIQYNLMVVLVVNCNSY